MHVMDGLNAKPVNGTSAPNPLSSNRSVAIFPGLTSVGEIRAPQAPKPAGTGQGIDEARIERAVREILIAIGDDPNREGIAETPQRVARAYRELVGGLYQSAEPHLSRTFESAEDGLVIVHDIEVHSLCEHHLLPFMGKAHVAYLPSNGRVVGLSKVARTVEVFARRPQLQERLSAQIADAFMEYLGPRGVTVLIQAEHLCMKLRGARSQSAMTTTATHRGVFAEDASLRQEVLTLLGAGSAQSTSTTDFSLGRAAGGCR